jgi:hypothetical protein
MELHPAEHAGVDLLADAGPDGGQPEAVDEFQGQV